MLKIAALLLSACVLLFSSQSFAGFFVCYVARHDVNTAYNNYVKYVGCRTSRVPCAYRGLRHFGEYHGGYGMMNAYNRCVYSAPRFVD